MKISLKLTTIITLLIITILAIYKLSSITFSTYNLDESISAQSNLNDKDLNNVKTEFVMKPIFDKFVCAKSVEDILSRGELVVCSIKNEVSEIFRNKDKNGNFFGKDIYFAKKMAECLGVKLKIKMFYNTYDDVVDAIQKGEGDVGISHLSYTAKRSLKVLFSEPYVLLNSLMLINQRIVSKATKSSLYAILNNKNSIIACPAGTSFKEFAKKLFPEAQIQGFYVNNLPYERAIRELKFDAFTFDELETKCTLRDNRDLSLLVLPVILKGYTDNISAIVNFKSAEFLLWINEFIKRIEKPENANSLMEKFKID